MNKIKEAYKRGYRVRDDGSVKGINKNNLSLYETGKGYYTFGIKIKGKKRQIKVHRLQAYQKFGDMMFGEDTVVRHLDGNPKNNRWDNIKIGTYSDNSMDRPKEQRIKDASNPKHPHKEVIDYYKKNDCTKKE